MATTGADTPDGAALFARFAYPPNALGYCGPADPHALLVSAAEGGEGGGPDLRQLARRFEGAWPYLQLIATANGLSDPLDGSVVEAYWIGNRMLDNVSPAMLGDLLDERFRLQLDAGRRRRGEALDPRACPHHNFHVFSVYPWVGLLRAGRSPEPLRILEKCRIRWGQVQDVAAETLTVRSEGLAWKGEVLQLGAVRDETVAWRHEGRGFIATARPGDWVAMHWDWACDVLTAAQRASLAEQTARQLAIVNGAVPPPGASDAGSRVSS
jgi:hypothetical protein